MSRLLRGRSRSCCESRPRATAGLSMVMSFWASADTVHGLGDRPELELRVHAGDARRAQHDAGLLVLLEVRGDDLDPVRARPQVRGLEAALRVGLDRAGDARALVGDQDRGLGHGAALGIDHGAADRAQEGLRRDGGGEASSGHEHDDNEPGLGRPCSRPRWSTGTFACFLPSSAARRSPKAVTGDGRVLVSQGPQVHPQSKANDSR